MNTSSLSVLDGLLLVNKPEGITSHDVVARVRKAIGQKGVGHTGTLDPLATGLMVLVLGDATKLSDFLITIDKGYRLKVRLGITTDTLDRTGQILSEAACDLSRDQIAGEVERLQGDFDWQVPLFSATKVGGKKLYEYGREGEPVDLPIKKMSFWGARIEETTGQTLTLTINCSKGSFVRSWAAQLGAALGVGGVVEELSRIRNGPWELSQAIDLERLESRGRSDLGEAFVPIASALPNWKSLRAGQKEARLMVNGQVPRELFNRLIVEQKQAFSLGEPVFVKVVTDEGGLLAILAAEPGQGLKIRRVFPGTLRGC